MNTKAVSFRELRSNDLESVLTFADKNIGKNYFTLAKIQQILAASQKNSICCSFVMMDEEGIQGIRLSYPPGMWIDRHPSQPIHPHLWDVRLEDAAYFQSLFIASRYQGQGWGQRLSLASIENLKMTGAKAVVCHSWDQSPGNSSRKYLDSLGFKAVISIPRFWHEIDYECVLCGRPCQCSATEMVRYI